MNMPAINTTSPMPRIRTQLVGGLILVLVFFGGLGLWSVSMQLESAAVAPGVLMVESNRKTIKHLEGGIVGQILIKEGDRVEAGQVLIRLDTTQAAAKLELLNSRKNAALAKEARLRAEQKELDRIAFPDYMASPPDGSPLAQIKANEESVFSARADARREQTNVLNQQIASLNEEISGLKSLINAQTRQLKLIKTEIDDIDTLYKKGLARKSRMLSLQREEADIGGRKAQNQAEIARIRQTIGETRIKINELKVNFQNDVAAELADNQTELFDLEERIRAAQDILTRTEILTPTDGIALGLTAHTIGGVIAPGEPIVEIVPENEKLVIDARIDPSDADVVRPGLDAEITFSAFSHRDSKPSKGVVTWMSADGILDEHSGQRYYLARVEIDKDGLQGIELSDLRPGMLADVFVLTGSQTPFDYLINPLLKNLSKSMREK